MMISPESYLDMHLGKPISELALERKRLTDFMTAFELEGEKTGDYLYPNNESVYRINFAYLSVLSILTYNSYQFRKTLRPDISIEEQLDKEALNPYVEMTELDFYEKVFLAIKAYFNDRRNKILVFCQEFNCNAAMFMGEYHGYDIFSPRIKTRLSIACCHQYVLVNKEECRLASKEEANEIEYIFEEKNPNLFDLI